MRLLLVNPNTSDATTARMVAIARATAPPSVQIAGATATSGSCLILDEAMLAAGAAAVVDLVRRLPTAPDGIIVSAFGDPGLDEVRGLVGCPVTGIAEAGMAEAAGGERPFAVATTTPALADAIAGKALAYGHGSLFRGVFLTSGDPATLMADGSALEAALEGACRDAVTAGAQAVVIGGGPLADAARTIAPRLRVPVVEPIPAAIRLAVRRAEERQNR